MKIREHMMLRIGKCIWYELKMILVSLKNENEYTVKLC